MLGISLDGRLYTHNFNSDLMAKAVHMSETTCLIKPVDRVGTLKVVGIVKCQDCGCRFSILRSSVICKGVCPGCGKEIVR